MIRQLLAGWDRYFRIVDLVVVGLVVAGFSVWLFPFGGYDSVQSVLVGNKSSVYGTVASILGSLLGFVIAAIAIVLGYADSGRLTLLRDAKRLDDLWRVFLQDIWWLSLATVVTVAALIFDRDSDAGPRWLFVATVAIVLMAGASVARSVWTLERLIGGVMRVSAASRSAPDVPGASRSKLPARSEIEDSELPS